MLAFCGSQSEPRAADRQQLGSALNLPHVIRLICMNPARYQSMANIIIFECARLNRPVRLLDIGCGQGRLLICCAGMPNIQFTGADIRAASLPSARAYGYASVLVVNAAHGLPFTSDAFDIVVCNHILENLRHPETLVDAAERVLIPGGLLLVGVPICSRWDRLRTKRDDVPQEPRFLTVESLELLLRRFRIEDLRGFTSLAGCWLPRANWYRFYRMNTAWGKRFPRWTSEVNVVARKAS